MEIVKLTSDNIENFSYPCMLKKTRWVPNPQHYRSMSISHLRKNIDGRIKGVVAIAHGKPIGYLFYGPLKGAGFPVQCSEERINAIFCTTVDASWTRKGTGKAMVESAVEDSKTTPGLLVLATGMKMFMPIKPFLKLGFRQIHDGEFWKIGYYPIQKESVQVETYTPQLEWDYVKPFTFITDDFCPLLIHLREEQMKIASKFQEQLPIEEIPFEEAVRKDENVTPGFYLYGKQIPPGFLTGWSIKRFIKKTIRDESRKTFGTTSPTEYTKRR